MAKQTEVVEVSTPVFGTQAEIEQVEKQNEAKEQAAVKSSGMTAAEFRTRVLAIIEGYLNNSAIRETQGNVMVLTAVAGDVQVIDIA